MVSKDSGGDTPATGTSTPRAAGDRRRRRVRRDDLARRLEDGWNAADGLFPALDARRLPVAGPKNSRIRWERVMKILIVSWEYRRSSSAGWGGTCTIGDGTRRAGTRWSCCRAAVGYRRVDASDGHRDRRRSARGRGRRGSAALHLRRGHAGVDVARHGSRDGSAPASHWRRRASARGQPDVVHAHDWLVGTPAIALAEFYDVRWSRRCMPRKPVGTAAGSRAGSTARCTRWSGGWPTSPDSIITCSASMHDEVTELYGPELPPITVIRNGIDVTTWSFRPRAPRSGPATCCTWDDSSTRRGTGRDRRDAADSAQPPRHDARRRR